MNGSFKTGSLKTSIILQFQCPGSPVTYETPYALRAFPMIWTTGSFITTYSVGLYRAAHSTTDRKQQHRLHRYQSTVRTPWAYNPARLSATGPNMNRRSFLSRSGRLLLTAGLAPMVFGANAAPEYNQRRSLTFSNDWIESNLIKSVKDLPVENEIVVNLSTTPLHYNAQGSQGTIPPWKSTILRHCTLEKGEMAALIHVQKRLNLGAVALDWEWYGRRNPDFPRGVPLYISAQDDIGDVSFDPLITFASQSSVPVAQRRYRLKLNLWYTPEETDCGIHTGHKFLEVH